MLGISCVGWNTISCVGPVWFVLVGSAFVFVESALCCSCQLSVSHVSFVLVGLLYLALVGSTLCWSGQLRVGQLGLYWSGHYAADQTNTKSLPVSLAYPPDQLELLYSEYI
jgi:hypothetical protein